MIIYAQFFDSWTPSYSEDDQGNRCISWRYLICHFINAPNPDFNPKVQWYSTENLSKYRDFCKVSQVDNAYKEAYHISNRKPKTFFDECTCIFAMNGPDSAFDDDNRTNGKKYPADLILFMEINEPSIHWLAPIDYEEIALVHNSSLSQVELDGRGFLVTFYDGSVYYMDKKTPTELLFKFATVHSASKYNRTLLEPFVLEKFDSSVN